MKERFLDWMNRNNMTFSAICGETFTNAEVMYAHVGMLVFFVVIGLIGE
jgi:hypothetical protein